MGETRVDLLHLLEDLRDAYTGAIEETILTEVTANALDSGATQIRFAIDPALATLTIIDNGSGMVRRDLARYHDMASSTKRKGQGIGFAGVGIKLGLLACRQVMTETRRGATHVATIWGLTSRRRAPWRWTPPAGLVVDRGTAVRLDLANVLSPLVDPGYVEITLRRHFATLLDPRFDTLLSDVGRSRVVLLVNNRTIEPAPIAHDRVAPIEIRLARKRKPSAIGYMERRPRPLPEGEQGIAISTLGKVIKRGWDWLGVTPTNGDLVSGLIEVPALAAALTLNKADFVRTGNGGAVYLSFRKALQEAVSHRLAEWGDVRPPDDERPPKAVGLKDFDRVLEALAGEFPMLGSLVDRRRGGQKPLPMARGESPAGNPAATHFDERAGGSGAEPVTPSDSSSSVPSADGAETARVEPPAPDTPLEPTTLIPSRPGSRRPQRFGLQLAFERRAGDDQLARLAESTVTINTGHPAYARALATRAMGYHVALSVAMALAPVAVEAGDQHTFLTNFLARWGEAFTATRETRRRQRKRRRDMR